MKLRNRISLLMAMLNTHNISNAIRLATGRKALPAPQMAGQSVNHGPGRSGNKTFKRNKRTAVKSIPLHRIYAQKASACKKYKRKGIVIRRNKALQLAHPAT